MYWINPKQVLLSFLFIFFLNSSVGQKIDSLLNLLETSENEDLQKIEIYNKLSVEYRSNNFELSKENADLALELSQKIGTVKWEGISHSNLGGAFYQNGKFQEAEKEFKASLKIFQQINYLEGISDAYGNLGTVAGDIDNSKKAIEYLLLANHLRDSLGLLEKLAAGYNNISNTYADLGDFKNATASQLKSLKIQKELNHKKGIAKSYSGLTRLHGMQGHMDSALVYAKKTITIYEEIENYKGLGIINFNCGHIYSIKGNFDQSYAHYSEARKWFEKTGNQNSFIQSEMNIGMLYYKHGEYEEALLRTKSAINFLKKSQDKSSLAVAYTNYANILYDFKKSLNEENTILDSLVIFHQKALSIYEEIDHKMGIARSLTNVGTVQWKQHDYKTAIRNLEEGIALFNKIGGRKNTGNALVSLGKCYIQINDYQKGIKYLEEAKILTEENNIFLDDLYLDLANAYFSSGNYKQSSVYYKKRISVVDSVFTKEKIEAISDVETKYQTEKKETENQLLKQEKNIQAITINNQKVTMYGGLAGIALLGGLSFLLYRQNKERKIHNLQLTNKNEKIELLHKELSHRVKNNLAFVSSLMKMQGRRLENEEAKNAVKEGQTRIDAMSLLHQKLFVQEENSDINIEEYLGELCANLQRTHPFVGVKPSIKLNVDDLLVDGETGMRIGLIINELITNSFKYAFDNESNPQITIHLQKGINQEIDLSYKDNGTGISDSINISQTKSLGLKLINMLTKQLKGTMKVENDNGAKFRFQFQNSKIAV